MPRRREPRVSGVLVLDKPAGLTSFAVVREVRRRLGERRAGHTGTLDPMATGVLPVCLGEATKIAGLLTAADKGYRATGELGLETDTLDASGVVTARYDWGAVGRGQLEEALEAMLGPQLQVPPAYSALRINGERAYDRARRGETVELEPRPVDVMELSLLDWAPPRFELEVTCSKGTYVRSLLADVGRRLECGAVLTALRRTRSGPFTVENAVPFEGVERGMALLGVDAALSHLPALEVDPAQADGLRHGQPLPPSAAPPPGDTLIRLHSGRMLIALGELRQGVVWPKRVFVGDHPADV